MPEVSNSFKFCSNSRIYFSQAQLNYIRFHYKSVARLAAGLANCRLKPPPNLEKKGILH